MNFKDLIYITLIGFILGIFYLFLKHMYIFIASFGMKNAPNIPTSQKSRQVILNIIKEKIIKEKGGNLKIADAGSGFGTLALYLAKNLPQIKIIGIEKDPLFFFISKLKAKLLRIKNAAFIRENIFNHSFRNYDVTITFLYGNVMKEFETKLENEMKKESYLIDNHFKLENKNPVKTYKSKISLLFKSNIYLYKY
jgi:SAM-dependent methyltransferase